MKNDLLRKARDDHGWTQERLAEELNVGVETVRSWENGRRSPGTAMRKRLCEIFGKTPEQLGLQSGPRPTIPLSDWLTAREKEAPQPAGDLLELFEPDVGTPQPMNDLLDTLEQDVPHMTFKKKPGGRVRVIAALVSSLTVVILILYFVVPAMFVSSSRKGAAPSPTPRTSVLTSPSPTPTIGSTSTAIPTPTIGPTSTIGPTPTTGSTPTVGPSPTIEPTPGTSSFVPISLTALGPLDFQSYCQASGNTGAVLSQNNATGWRCITPSSSLLIVNTDTACQSQYQRSDALSRTVNFFDPNDWHCYGNGVKLGGVNFAEYCQSLGLQAYLSGQTVYDWRCSTSSTDTGQLIDVNKACLWQYRGYQSFASVTDYFDPNGWTCIGAHVFIAK